MSNLVSTFIFARFILGLGAPFTIVASSSLIVGEEPSIVIQTCTVSDRVWDLVELAYPKERPVLSSLFAASYSVGRYLISYQPSVDFQSK